MNPSVPMSPSEFLVFAAVCDLKTATSGEVHSRLTDHHRRDFGSQAVAVLLLRVQTKGWLYTAESNGTEPRFAPAATYAQALALQFRRFLSNHAVDRPEAFDVLQAELRAAADDTAG